MQTADKKLYLVICEATSRSYVDKEFLHKIAMFNQFVRIGETSWLIYSADSLEQVCEKLHGTPQCKADIKVDEFTTRTVDEAWKQEVIAMMKTLYSRQEWITN